MGINYDEIYKGTTVRCRFLACERSAVGHTVIFGSGYSGTMCIRGVHRLSKKF